MHKYQPKGQSPLFSKAAIKREVVRNALERRSQRKRLTIVQKRELGYRT